MDRRTALAAAGATALSVLAVGAALTTNLRAEPADAGVPAAVTATAAPLEPTVVTVVVPAPAASAPAVRSTPGPSAPVVVDDDGGDDDGDDDSASHGRGGDDHDDDHDDHDDD